MDEKKRTVVIPSQVLGDTNTCKAGKGTFKDKESGKIFAERLGILEIQTYKNQKGESESIINVKPLKGRYDPTVGDTVIGIVEEALGSGWLVDINASSPALLHQNEVPWKVDFGDAERYLNKGDSIMAKILQVDESKKLQITLNDRNLYKIKDGHIIEFKPSIYRRIIGKKFSMIEIIQKYTGCRIKVGKNGRIWINGDAEGIKKVLQAISKIENEAIMFGLTNRIEEMLKKDAKDVR